MKTFQKYLPVLLVCLLASFLLGACTAVSNQDVTLSLKEASVNEIIQSVPPSDDTPFRISGIDMKNGYMTVYMSYRRADETNLTGSYDVAFKVDNGNLTSSISNVNMAGLQLDQAALKQISDLIAKDFLLAATKLGGRVDFKALNVTDDAINLVVNIQ